MPYYSGYSDYYYSKRGKREIIDDAREAALELKNRGLKLAHVPPVRGALAKSWWGQSWNYNLERYSDMRNRLERGRSYLRNGAVIHLSIEAGRVLALVAGSAPEPYEVKIKVKPIEKERWNAIVSACAGKVHSLEELSSGGFPRELAAIFLERGKGLFPAEKEIGFRCDCPDYARMCKHVAAALYGVGVRLDETPALFFTLRGVSPDDLVAGAAAETSRRMLERGAKIGGRVMKNIDTTTVFGIEIDGGQANFNESINGGSMKPINQDNCATKGRETQAAEMYQAINDIIVSNAGVMGRAIKAIAGVSSTTWRNAFTKGPRRGLVSKTLATRLSEYFGIPAAVFFCEAPLTAEHRAAIAEKTRAEFGDIKKIVGRRAGAGSTTVKKRGPGRPPKSAKKVVTVAKAIIQKRKPGRPPKNSKPATLATSTPKRKPGRPSKKSMIDLFTLPISMKKPGRPPKKGAEKAKRATAKKETAGKTAAKLKAMLNMPEMIAGIYFSESADELKAVKLQLAKLLALADNKLGLLEAAREIKNLKM